MDKLRILLLVEIDLLKEFIGVCKENNLRYYMLGGTLLGAVRHKGFIPWDDDIDVGMPRKDYEKFLQIIKEKNYKNIVIDNYELNQNTLIYITRLENSQFKIKDKSALEEKERNAWIDIFPMDGMPNNIILRQIHKFHLLYLRMLFKYSIFSQFVNQMDKNRPFHEKVLIKIGKVFNFEEKLSKKKCLKKLDKSMKKYDFDNSKYVVNFMGAYKFREMFPKKIYEDTKLYDFEGEKLIGPKNYDYVLTRLYGDYMMEPDDKNHHYTEIE